MYFTIGASLTILNIGLVGPSLSTPALIQHDFGSKEEVEEWHTIHFTATQSGANINWSLYVDGSLAGTATTLSYTLRALDTVQLSSVTNATGTNAFGHLAIYSTNAASASPSEIDAAAQGNLAETPTARAKRIAEEYGYGFGWIGSSSSDGKPMGAQRVVDVSTLLNDAEKVDGGILYEQRSTAAFQFRTLESMGSRSSWCTLSMGSSKHLTSIEPVSDDRVLCNRFTARRADGGDYQFSLDTGAMSTLAPESGGIGVLDRGDTFSLSSEVDLPDIASYQVARGTIDQERYVPVVVDLHRSEIYGDSSLLGKLRDLDVGDQVTLADLDTSWVYDNRDVLVLGVSGRLDQFRHTLSLTTMPAELLRVWVLGSTTSSASEFARADSDYTTVDEGLTTTETDVTIRVATDKAFWVNSTSHPNNFPFNVMCEGEEWSVTAGTAPSGQNQTWTVTRSVNGVVKEHSTGAKVSLARPNYLGL